MPYGELMNDLWAALGALVAIVLPMLIAWWVLAHSSKETNHLDKTSENKPRRENR